MQTIQPPISLEGLPLTEAVWGHLMGFQDPLRLIAKLARTYKIKNLLKYTIWPATPNASNGVYKMVCDKLSMHERLEHHSLLKAFEFHRMGLAMSLQTHPAHYSKEHNLILKAHAKAKVLTGTHKLSSGIIEWKAGSDYEILKPFLTRLAQYERLSQITPEGKLKNYALVYKTRSSTNYEYIEAVDAADAALKSRIGNRKPLFQGAQLHPKGAHGPLPDKGSFPEGEEDWLYTIKKRAKVADIPLNILPDQDT